MKESKREGTKEAEDRSGELARRIAKPIFVIAAKRNHTL